MYISDVINIFKTPHRKKSTYRVNINKNPLLIPLKWNILQFQDYFLSTELQLISIFHYDNIIKLNMFRGALTLLKQTFFVGKKL